MRRLSAFALALSLSCAAAPLAARAQVPPAAAVADASRPADDRAKDASRKPVELIAFAGIKPGDTVMDLWPGGGYWSRIFSKVVGPKGHVYAYVPAEITDFKGDPLGKAKAMAAEPGLGNVEAISDPLSSQPPPAFANVLDVVWTFENYHDLHDPFLKGASVPDVLRQRGRPPRAGRRVRDRGPRRGRGLGAQEHRRPAPHRPGDGQGRAPGRGLRVRRRVQGARQPCRSPHRGGVRPLGPRQDRPVRLPLPQAEVSGDRGGAFG